MSSSLQNELTRFSPHDLKRRKDFQRLFDSYVCVGWKADATTANYAAGGPFGYLGSWGHVERRRDKNQTPDVCNRWEAGAIAHVISDAWRQIGRQGSFLLGPLILLPAL